MKRTSSTPICTSEHGMLTALQIIDIILLLCD
jgi:hypothetical protein